MPSKYLILQTPEGEKAVIFPEDNFYHDEMAERLDQLGIIAAGFVQIEENGKVHCFGRSESLEIEGRGEDDAIVIARQLAIANKT